MATLSDANVNAFFNQVWDVQVLQARYGKAVTMPRVLNRSELVSDSGVIVHIPIKPRVSGGTVDTSGGFTAEAITITDVQVNVNTWRYVSHIITDKQSKQSIVTLETELPSQFGEKLAEFYDIALNNLMLNLTGGSETLQAGQGLGTPGVGTTFLEDTALGAVLSLRRRNIPMEDMSWILSPECFYLGWLTKERMTSVMHTGEDKSVLTTNYRQKILGIPAYESTLLNGSTATDDNGVVLNAASAPNITGTTACALIHKEALAIVMQINNKYEKVRTTPNQQLATLIVAQNLFGAQVTRQSNGALMYIKNA